MGIGQKNEGKCCNVVSVEGGGGWITHRHSLIPSHFLDQKISPPYIFPEWIILCIHLSSSYHMISRYSISISSTSGSIHLIFSTGE